MSIVYIAIDFRSVTPFKRRNIMLGRYKVHKLIAEHSFPSHKRAIVGWMMLTCLLLALFSACSTSQTASGNSSAAGAAGQNSSSTATASANTTSSTPTSGSVTPLNTNITYASVEIAIIDVKQAKTFSDDTTTSPSAVLRLDLKENNPTADSAYYDYSDVARLLLPDGTKVAPLSTQLPDPSIGPSIERNNWIDFPVALSVKVNQLSLQLGKDTEAQEIIPLTAGADVSKYAAKNTSPNAKMTYGTINWTVTTATSELSYGGKQADKGMMFVVAELNADNTGSSTGGGDLVQVRLKSGDTTSPAQEFLNDVAGNQTNVKSTVSFIMPQGSTNFTLIFLPSNAYGITTQSSVDFQIA
jgi:hypothetical protein